MAENSAPGGTPGAITAEELTHWREVCERATGGLWARREHPYECENGPERWPIEIVGLYDEVGSFYAAADAAFAAMARHAIPRLLDEVDRLRALLAEPEEEP